MNQKTLIAIIILAGIGSIGSVLAYSGTISAGQGNFNNVLVTGTCVGCGGTSITNYNVTSSNSAGTAPVNFTSALYSIAIISNASYDGILKVQYEKTDNSWNTQYTLTGSSSTVNTGDSYFEGFPSGTPGLYYPYHIRVLVDTQASTGGALISYAH